MREWRKVVFLAVGLLFVAAAASANNITFQASDTIGVNVFQQTNNNPCVVGDMSCKEPAGMGYEAESGTPGGMNGSTYDLFSPVYVAATGVNPFNFNNNTIPTAFTIGVDENIAKGAGNEVLNFFKVWDCGAGSSVGPTTQVSGQTSLPSNCMLAAAETSGAGGNSYTTVTTIPNENNGNGFSDFILTGFTLTAGHFYVFEASVSNDSDGMEEFFIIPQGSPAVTPEPGTLVLFGSGLLGVAGILRKKFSS